MNLILNGEKKNYECETISEILKIINLEIGADGVHLGQEDMPINEARHICHKKK